VIATATIRIQSAEEIAAQAGGQAPWVMWPERGSVFAERAMRMRQLAAGHAMGDFLSFLSSLAQAQQAALDAFADVPLPDGGQVDRAAADGVPLLPAADWPRAPAWRDAARAMARALHARAPVAARDAMAAMASADDDWLERQADCLLTGVMRGLQLSTSAVVAGALQAYWTHLVLATRQRHRAQGEAFGRIDDPLSCPCCGSAPVVGVTRYTGGATGQRYLVCGLCSSSWHLPRGRCAHCGSDKHVAYQSLALAGGDALGDAEARAAKAAVQAETCDDCGHYLKLLHSDRDPLVEPSADDLASLTLDLLVADSGKQRHGVNLMLLFGAPDSGSG